MTRASVVNVNCVYRLALLERDGEGGGVKFCMSAEKELSQDDQGQTPIVNRRRSEFVVMRLLKIRG